MSGKYQAMYQHNIAVKGIHSKCCYSNYEDKTKLGKNFWQTQTWQRITNINISTLLE